MGSRLAFIIHVFSVLLIKFGKIHLFGKIKLIQKTKQKNLPKKLSKHSLVFLRALNISCVP